MAKNSSRNSGSSTWLRVTAIVGILGVILFTAPGRKACLTGSTIDEVKASKFLVRLIKNHPDKRVSDDFNKNRRQGRIYLVVKPLTVGLGGSFVLYTSQGKKVGFGTSHDKSLRPTIVLNQSTLKSAQEGDGFAYRSLERSLWHEYMHYLQWEKQEFFQEPFATDELERSCLEIWNREFPIYREECLLVEKWWPNNRSISPPERCRHKNDPSRFAQAMYDLLNNKEPECQEVWSRHLE